MMAFSSGRGGFLLVAATVLLLSSNPCLNSGPNSKVVVDAKPFCYLDEDEADQADCYGVEDWDEVEEEEYYFDWDRFSDDNLSRRQECEWKPVGDRDRSHRQSPVDLDRDYNDCDIEKDDKVHTVYLMLMLMLYARYNNFSCRFDDQDYTVTLLVPHACICTGPTVPVSHVRCLQIPPHRN
jgi:hypothetical protein